MTGTIPGRDQSYCNHFHHSIDVMDNLQDEKKIEGKNGTSRERIATGLMAF